MEFRKITCDSEEFDNIVIAIKNNVLSKNNMPAIKNMIKQSRK